MAHTITRNPSLAGVTAALLITLTATSAAALPSPIGPANSYGVSGTAGGTDIQSSSTTSVATSSSYSFPGYGSASASAATILTPEPGLFLSTTSSYDSFLPGGESLFAAQAEGHLVYFMHLTGPAGLVPITIDTKIDTGALETTASGESGGWASLDIFGETYFTGYGLHFCTTFEFAAGNPCGDTAGADLHIETEFFANMDYEFMLFGASASVAHNPGDFASSWASIDPVITVLVPGYTVTFSPGVGPDPTGPGVPEPAEWALLIGGLGLAGAALRRQSPGSLHGRKLTQ